VGVAAPGLLEPLELAGEQIAAFAGLSEEPGRLALVVEASAGAFGGAERRRRLCRGGRRARGSRRATAGQLREEEQEQGGRPHIKGTSRPAGGLR
jgi:hypothetical protein